MRHVMRSAEPVAREVLGQLGVRVVGEIDPDLSYAPDGRLVIQRSSACSHGDGPNAVAVACALRRAVTETGREIETAGAAE